MKLQIELHKLRASAWVSPTNGFPPTAPSWLSRQVLWKFLGILPVVLGSFILAYYRMFTGFSKWDDEGYVMMTVKQYLNGERLYGTVYSCYGPLFYLYNRVLYLLAGSGVTHNHVRMVSATLWVIVPLSCAWMVWRLTRSLAPATLAFGGVVQTLMFFRNEPGHPQELCMLLMITLVSSGLLAASEGRRWLAALLAGTLPAALLLVKVNIGGFVIVAVALSLVSGLGDSRLVRALKYLVSVGALLTPFVLMRIHLDDPQERAYCAVVTISVAALFVARRRAERRAVFAWRHCLVAVGAFTAVAAFSLTIMVAQGVKLGEMLNSLVLAQLRINIQQRAWFLPLDLDPGWILWALAGLGFAIMNRHTPPPMRAILRASLGVGGLALALNPAVAGFRYAALLSLIAPFCFLLLDPPHDQRKPEEYARLLLAFVAVMQSLYAYPIAGSQAAFQDVLMAVTAATFLGDAMREVPQRWSRTAKALAGAAGVVVILFLTAQTVAWIRLYKDLTPLALPGAERIHMDAGDAALYQKLVRDLKQNCETFAGLPGFPSLYFWTRQPLPGPAGRYPGPLNEDDWMFLLTSAEQQVIVDDLARHNGLCVVRSVRGVAFWNKTGHSLEWMPLVHFIDTSFSTTATAGEYELMLPKVKE